MLVKSAALGDERIFGTYKNVEASSLTTGYLVALAAAAASFDGTQACLAGTAATGRQINWIGVAAKDIAPNAYGLVQQYGLCASVFLSNVGTSLTITLGDACVPAALPGSAFCAVPTWANAGFAALICVSFGGSLGALSSTGYMTAFMKHGL
jgi:hypothetical protein